VGLEPTPFDQGPLLCQLSYFSYTVASFTIPLRCIRESTRVIPPTCLARPQHRECGYSLCEPSPVTRWSDSEWSRWDSNPRPRAALHALTQIDTESAPTVACRWSEPDLVRLQRHATRGSVSDRRLAVKREPLQDVHAPDGFDAGKVLRAKALLASALEGHAALIELDVNYSGGRADRAVHFLRLRPAFAIFAAFVFDMPLRRRPWYFFQFLICGPGTLAPLSALARPDLLLGKAAHARLSAVARARLARGEFSDVASRGLTGALAPPGHELASRAAEVLDALLDLCSRDAGVVTQSDGTSPSGDLLLREILGDWSHGLSVARPATLGTRPPGRAS
jgi:hypothetical protein